MADDVVATIRNGNEAVAGAFGRALDGEFSVAVAEAVPIALESPPDEWHGPGLVIAIAVGDSGALLLLPKTSGLLPAWCAEPDATGQSKLTTLAQELASLVMPEGFTAGQSKTAYVSQLSDSFQSCDPAEHITGLPITLTCGEQSGTAHLVWPVLKPLAATSEPDTNEVADSSADQQRQSAGEPTAQAPAQPTRQRIRYTNLEDGIRQLPNYAQSLLKVEVPVTVTLSTTKQSVEQILQLGPGSILQFDKRCEENLELEVGGQTVAAGEAVKVGDKFGLWITAMTIPGERFWVINGKRTGTRVQ